MPGAYEAIAHTDTVHRSQIKHWEKSSLSRVFERISRISGTTSSFSHVSQRLGLKFSLASWPAVAHTHPLAGRWAVLGRGASEGLSILLAGSHSFFAHAFPKATLTSEIHTSAALVSCHEEQPVRIKSKSYFVNLLPVEAENKLSKLVFVNRIISAPSRMHTGNLSLK